MCPHTVKVKTILFWTIPFSVSRLSMSKTVLFQVIQFSNSILFSSTWPMNRTLSDATTLGQNGPRSNGNEEVHCIPKNSSIIGTSPSNCLVSYPGHLLGVGYYPSAEVQSVYFTAPASWAIIIYDITSF